METVGKRACRPSQDRQGGKSSGGRIAKQPPPRASILQELLQEYRHIDGGRDLEFLPDTVHHRLDSPQRAVGDFPFQPLTLPSNSLISFLIPASSSLRSLLPSARSKRSSEAKVRWRMSLTCTMYKALEASSRFFCSMELFSRFRLSVSCRSISERI